MAKTKKVALLIESSNTYGRELLHGIRSWMGEHGSWVVRFSEQRRGEAVPEWLDCWTGDGVITRVKDLDTAKVLAGLGCPVVDVGAEMPEPPPFPRIITDSEAITHCAFMHFRERGLSRFAYCGDSRFPWSRQRGEFFSRKVQAAGYGPCAVFSAEQHRITGLEELGQWLQSLGRQVGVFACYDVLGREVLEACKMSGLRVPEEVAVLGVHNDDLLCDLCDPPLSSVIPNARRAGYEAAQVLARMMDGKKIPAHTRLIEPLGVEARRSTEAFAVDDPHVAKALRLIQEQSDRALQVTDILEELPLSRTLFERRFKQQLGCSPGQYIGRIRFARVARLLVSTTLSIAEIAEKLDFAYVESLSISFKRHTGLSPTDYRRRHRKTAGSDS